MAYVSRSADGTINGVFEQLQDGRAEEFIDDDNPLIVAYLIVAYLSAGAAATSVSARQFKLQLLAAGLLDTVDAWVAQQPRDVRIAYECSGTFVKDSPMMAAGFAAMGFSAAEIDAFFQAAANL